jgi:hypothetical protein
MPLAEVPDPAVEIAEVVADPLGSESWSVLAVLRGAHSAAQDDEEGRKVSGLVAVARDRRVADVNVGVSEVIEVREAVEVVLRAVVRRRVGSFMSEVSTSGARSASSSRIAFAGVFRPVASSPRRVADDGTWRRRVVCLGTKHLMHLCLACYRG